ncbi:MAG: hypothetical protein HC800_14860 [Phormidesmis sp. RL_2_1]|nr:hypothetical protein [Phormidesmis sp. RL_2_1]
MVGQLSALAGKATGKLFSQLSWAFQAEERRGASMNWQQIAADARLWVEIGLWLVLAVALTDCEQF